MSDIFENDIDSENDLSGLEDNDTSYESTSDEHYVFNEPLYRLKLEYSCEGLYANVDDESMELNPGDKVIVPTRYGSDLAVVLVLRLKLLTHHRSMGDDIGTEVEVNQCY